MRRGRLAPCVALLVAATPAAAGPPVTVAAGYGPAGVVGIGASRFEHGHASELTLRWEGGATAWSAHLGSLTLSRPATVLGFTPLPGGGTEPVYATHAGLSAMHALAGLSRVVPIGRLAAGFEANVGAAGVDDDEWEPMPLSNGLGNIAWTANGFEPIRTGGHIAPAFGCGVSVETPLPGSITLRSSVSARFLPLRGVAGAVVPFEVGARWPAAVERAESNPSRRSPRFRAATGWSAFQTPSALRAGLARGGTTAVELELPLGERLSVSLAGEQLVREQTTTHYHAVGDGAGGYTVEPFRYEEGTLAITTVTAGLRIERPVGFTTLSLRAGTGWGKTGGFGTSYDIAGTTFVWNGAGAPENGWASAISAAAEVPVAGPVRAYAESGWSVLRLSHDTVGSVPLRFGLALR